MLQPKNKVTVLTKEPSPSGDVISPTTAGIRYSGKNAEARVARTRSGFNNSETEGLKVENGHTTAKPFTRKVVESPNGTVRIIGSDGTVIKEGRKDSKDMQDAIRESEKKVKDVNSRRENNARGNNLVGGSATNITQKDVNRLDEIGHTSGNVPNPRIVRVIRNENRERAAINAAAIAAREEKANQKTTKVRVVKNPPSTK
jgi:hypothetical protein